MTQLLQAEGPISRPYFQAARLIASCAEWQRLCGSAAAGFARVHYPEASDIPTDDAELPADARPRIIIDDGPMFEMKADGVGGDPYSSGTLLISIEIPVYERVTFWPQNLWPTNFWPEDLWPAFDVGLKDQKTALTNALGRLFRQMFAKAGQSPEAGDVEDPLGLCHLHIDNLKQVQSPGLCDPTAYNGNYFGSGVYVIHWSGS